MPFHFEETRFETPVYQWDSSWGGAVRSKAAEQQQQQLQQQPRIFDQLTPSTYAGMKYAGMDKSLPPI